MLASLTAVLPFKVEVAKHCAFAVEPGAIKKMERIKTGMGKTAHRLDGRMVFLIDLD